MAAADTAKLLVSLEFVDRFSKGINTAGSNLGKFSKSVAKSRAVAVGLGVGLERAATAGIRAMSGAITDGIDLLAQLEDANSTTTAALKTSGLAAEVSTEQIRAWSDALEESSKFAFDDKAIQRAANTLVSFGDISSESLQQAMEVAVDLAPRFGDVESAAESLAKSLVDPTTATRILKTAGISLTKTEKEKVKALVESGKKAEAQAFLLDKLSASTKGLAAASQGPYRQSLATLAEASEEAKMALAEGLMPAIIEIAAELNTFLKDPSVKQGLKDLGTGMGDAFKSALKFAKTIPWGAVSEGLRTAAGFAKTLISAFTNLPPEAQATIIALAGLNKLSGGAVTGVIGSIGGGIAKGLSEKLGGLFSRGGSPATPMFVTDVSKALGGTPVGGAAGGAAGKLGAIGNAVMKVAVVGMAAGVAVALAGEFANQSGQIREQGKNLQETAKDFGNTAKNEKDILNAIKTIDEQFRDPLNAFALNMTDAFNGGKTALVQTRADLVKSLALLRAATASGDDRTAARIGSLDATLRAKNFSPTVNVSTGFTITTNVSVRDTVTAITKREAYNRVRGGTTRVPL